MINKETPKPKMKDLLNIQNRSDIKSFEILERYEDDHLQCSLVLINGIKIGFNYYDELGFLDYYDESDRAFNNLKEAIKTSVDIFYDS
tara:strand:- start:141 stop:404 length:264 start_codon:yes stop_codon:yes gene_type:complete